MKFYQVVGIFAILSLVFPDCYGYPHHKPKDVMGKGKDKEMKIRAMMETGMAVQDIVGNQNRKKHDGMDAKEERFGIVFKVQPSK